MVNLHFFGSDIYHVWVLYKIKKNIFLGPMAYIFLKIKTCIQGGPEKAAQSSLNIFFFFTGDVLF